MAKLASSILMKGESTYKKRGFGDWLRNLFSKDVVRVGDFDSGNFKIDGGIVSLGIQSCPFGCKGKDKYGYNSFGSGQVYVERIGERSELLEKYVEIQMETEDMESEKERLKEIGIEYGGMIKVMYLSSFTVVSDLTPHLIASHNFFQGDASYRTDPKKLLEAFRGV
jgi:hypothetical protein